MYACCFEHKKPKYFYFYLCVCVIPWHHLRENNTETLWDIQMLWRNWCEIHTLMWQSDYYEIHTKKATVWLLRNKYPYAAIRLVRATYHSTQKHSYFFMKKITKKNYFRCRCKAALKLNGSAAHNGTICLLFGLINSSALYLYYFFSRSSSWTNLFAGLLPWLRWTTFHATIW